MSDVLEIHQAHPTLSLNEALVRGTIERAASGEGRSIISLSIVLADHEAVHALNRDWLGHDFETDVVSFPLDDDAVARREIDGEVYVDLDTAAERAPDYGATFEREAVRYALHGVLHLMGYDDAEETQRARMRELEDRYLPPPA